MCRRHTVFLIFYLLFLLSYLKYVLDKPFYVRFTPIYVVVDRIFFIYHIMRREAAGIKTLEHELKKLLSLKLDTSEKNDLESRGFRLKNPTKLTLLAAALVEKGAKGDLSAIKEIFARLEGEGKEEGGVVLIDDIKNSS